jgi:hypothetical protein
MTIVDTVRKRRAREVSVVELAQVSLRTVHKAALRPLAERLTPEAESAATFANVEERIK